MIVKPDGVERGLVGEIVSRLERKQLRLVAAELRTIDQGRAERHYAEHAGGRSSTTSSPSSRGPVARHDRRGSRGHLAVVRLMMGVTNAAEAAPGTIRGDLAIGRPRIWCTARTRTTSAEREIAIFFPDSGR